MHISDVELIYFVYFLLIHTYIYILWVVTFHLIIFASSSVTCAIKNILLFINYCMLEFIILICSFYYQKCLFGVLQIEYITQIHHLKKTCTIFIPWSNYVRLSLIYAAVYFFMSKTSM